MTPLPLLRVYDRRPLRIHFDLTRQDRWHRLEWEHTLEAIAGGAGTIAELVDQPTQADCMIAAVTPEGHSGGGIPVRKTKPAGGPPCFVWDANDLPKGHERGFYCSLPRGLFDSRRHRTFCYPIRYNECVRPADLSEARYLYGFVGGITSGLRARLLTALRHHGHSTEMMVLVQGGPWNRMFDRTGILAKRQFADALRLSRFFLCPRGNGVGSVRLFETMQSARVPVIISDEYVLPTQINWDSCSIRVKESDVPRLPALLRARASEWTQLATNARAAWEQNFDDGSLLPRLARDLVELLGSSKEESPWQFLRLARHWALSRSRRVANRLRFQFDRRNVARSPASPSQTKP